MKYHPPTCTQFFTQISTPKFEQQEEGEEVEESSEEVSSEPDPSGDVDYDPEATSEEEGGGGNPLAADGDEEESYDFNSGSEAYSPSSDSSATSDDDSDDDEDEEFLLDEDVRQNILDGLEFIEDEEATQALGDRGMAVVRETGPPNANCPPNLRTVRLQHRTDENKTILFAILEKQRDEDGQPELFACAP